LLSAATNLTITVNHAPVVSAGAAQLITLPQVATLNGTVSDDGLPTGSTLVVSWSKVSGSGTVNFGNPAAAATTVSFTTSGIYVLQLSATDGAASSSDTVTITVNQAPVVDAGPNQTISWPSNQVVLSGTATDDGLPPGSNLTFSWSKLSGPGVVTFGNSA